MTNEDMQRAMNFIVQQQAQSSARIDSIGEKLEALAETQARNTEGIQALLTIAQIHERQIETLSHQIGSVSRDGLCWAKPQKLLMIASTPLSASSSAK
jgi:hypothetical protein